ncbi:glycosyltransferase [Flavihumibacter rivuli]|uniref:glycosyltransferase n=1 Tax=Flavihumibacter rivuli TaxID=2838156 RepID=UPI001BDDE50B|nr:glycosyltransferase [Flavihumibacter rivuli]ULQ55642.1 glycosyltransferase [Flavihumibacter rivuli]
MVTVIIPALNEEKTVGKVVRYCLQHEVVTEVIVVDDQSEDKTREVAESAGAKVIISATRGKGSSMEDGIKAASNEFLVFLDGDIDPYPQPTIFLLTDPLLRDEVDFVKAGFSRNAGRVTELVAKPLINIFYPGLARFEQPLSGMIAGKKKFFQRIRFFSDYGVDIGILIDMYLMQARMKEVCIGYIENKSKPWQALGKMSYEVTRAIIAKSVLQMDDVVAVGGKEVLNRISSEMKNMLPSAFFRQNKMVLIDADKLVMEKDFNFLIAERLGLQREMKNLVEKEKDPSTFTKKIATLLKGASINLILQTASETGIRENIVDQVQELKAMGVLVGVISNHNSYVAEYCKNVLGADFSIGNHLESFEGLTTGEVRIPSCFYTSNLSLFGQAISKTNTIPHLCNRFQVLQENCYTAGFGLGKHDISNDGLHRAFATVELLVAELRSEMALIDQDEKGITLAY